MFRIAICDETLFRSEMLAANVRSCVWGSGTGLTVECYPSFTELKRAVRKELSKYRLIILETDCGDEDGVEAACDLREMGYIADIVFCTKDQERAMDAYAAFPTYCMIKPYSINELCAVISFVAERNGKKPSIIINGEDGRKNAFRVDDIIYIEVFRTELEVHHANGCTTCTGSLTEVLEKLPSERFYRAHRSFVVNLGRVERIEKYQFTMDNGDTVTVAKNRYAEAKQAWRRFCS